MTALIKGKNIDTSKVSFSQPRVLDNGAKLVYMNYDGGRLTVQSPWMSLPWKMGVYTEGEFPKYSIDLSFKGMDDDTDLLAFHDRLQEVEEKIVDAGFENSVSWFKKKKTTREVVEASFNPILKVSKDKDTGEPDGKWPPTMKLKVARKNGVWESNKDKPLVVKNQDGVAYKINSEDNLEEILTKNTRIRVKMSCVGLWVASGNYMCQWQLTHAEVDVPEDVDGDEFLPDSDDEGNGGVASKPSKDGGVIVDDSDGNGDDSNGDDGNGNGDDGNGDGDDGNGDDAVEPEPEPVKKKMVKRKVVKKAE
jgi:hypothetical protein